MRIVRPPNTFEGFLVKGIDGDTVEVLIGLPFEVHIGKSLRLQGIESWELASAECARAQAAAAMINDNFQMHPCIVTCSQRGLDKYGRIVGSVSIAGVDLATWLVSRGLAWRVNPADYRK